MKEITALELMTIYRTVSVVDVREPDEYVAGHIPGAVNVPLSLVPLRFNELDKAETQYLICESGVRSAQACAYLEQQGFDVVNIAGGTGELRMMGTPLNMGEQA
jgi:rhodanese-related sulfurtransferase